MRPGIPKYGRNFSLEHLPYEPGRDFAPRRYVLKADKAYSIRSSRDSEHWTIFIAGPAGAQFPHGKPHNTLTEAMTALLAMRVKPVETDDKRYNSCNSSYRAGYQAGWDAAIKMVAEGGNGQ